MPNEHKLKKSANTTSDNDRKPLISGNWKMHLNHFEAIQMVQKLFYNLPLPVYDRIDVSIHPPFTSLRSLQTVFEVDRMPIALGAQNCHNEDSGAFTGEISPLMLAKLNVAYVIVGHSERRQLLGETDRQVNAKVHAVLKHGMTPIVCVGETLEQRQAGSAATVVSTQITNSLEEVTAAQVSDLIIAYEPVWAIGTGKTATPADAQAMCAHIRSQIESKWGNTAAESLRIQYGGSVKASNIAELMAKNDIDGTLVGGASLKVEDFAPIVNHFS